MKIETRKFGTINFEETDIVRFDQGIIGFPELSNFIILTPEGNTPFKWMQSIDNLDITFVIINPQLVVPDYKITINRSDIKNLKAESVDNIEFYSIITIPENPKDMTVNLLGPIILNTENRTAKQIALEKTSYSTKHRVIN